MGNDLDAEASGFSRSVIVSRFAEWTAFSAARMAPVRSRQAIYPLVRRPHYGEIMSKELGRITMQEFDKWHKENTEEVCESSKENPQTSLPIGWCTKLINVYLKTRVYLAGEGRPDLIRWVHPPIDNNLVDAIERAYANDSEVMERIRRFSSIRAIDNYGTYETIIEGCRLIAKRRNYACLIEVEELWQPY